MTKLIKVSSALTKLSIHMIFLTWKLSNAIIEGVDLHAAYCDRDCSCSERRF